MITYTCDGCGKELKVRFVGRMEPDRFLIELKHEDGTLIRAKIESMHKPQSDEDIRNDHFGDPYRHICSECLAGKVSESKVAVVI